MADNDRMTLSWLNYPEHQHRVWPMQILISRNLLHNNSFS